MKLYLFSGSGFSWRVQLACAIKDIDYEPVFLEPTQKSLKSDTFLALNPRGKVPVLEDEGFVISESMAAIAYLDRKHPAKTLFGQTAEETGEIWRIIFDFDLYVSANFVNNIIVPVLSGQFDSEEHKLQQSTEQAHDEIAKIEANLNQKNWFVGKTISAADIAIYPLLEALIRFAGKPAVAHLNLGFDNFNNTYPNLCAWRKGIQQSSNYDRTYPDYWRQLDQDQ